MKVHINKREPTITVGTQTLTVKEFKQMHEAMTEVYNDNYELIERYE